MLTGVPASAAIVNLTITPGSIAFTTTTVFNLIQLQDGRSPVGTFVAFNSFYSGTSTFTTGTGTVTTTFSGYYRSFGSPGIYTAVPNPINQFVPGPVASGSPISSGNATNIYVSIPSYVAGVYTFGFMTPANQPGWIRMSFDPVPGAITYLAAAYNDTPGSTINAGQTSAAIPESSTTMALAGLSTLAAGVGIRRLRAKRRQAKADPAAN